MKRNINDLMINNGWSSLETFKGKMETYDKLTKQIEEKLKEKEAFDILQDETNLSREAENFRSALNLYHRSIEQNQPNEKDIYYLFNQCPNLKKYLILCEKIRELREAREKILKENISFQDFGGDEYSDEMCDQMSGQNHAIVKIGHDLVCAFCGATSKDFDLSEDETNFLALCAKSQGMFLSEVTENDIPLLRVLIEEERKNRKYRHSKANIKRLERELGIAADEELWLQDAGVISNLQRNIVWAKMLDAKVYETEDYRVGNPKYLNDEEAKKILEELNNHIACLEGAIASTQTVDLKLEICRTYRYEVLILSGVGIPELYNSAIIEEEKIALVKAYFNLSNINYRVNSGYFKPVGKATTALFYTCLTAHPEINKKLFEMKIRR